jgi:hypothetical protein
VQTQHRDNTSKETYMALPAGRLSELAYNIGKPSALAGAVAAPLLGDKQTAKRTALAATGLSLPMVLSELLARYGDAKGQIATGNAPDTMGTHLNAQSKALPYAALAALPLLSYGGANLLGRWKGQKPDEGSTAKSVGALSGGGAGMAAGSALGPLGAAGGGILGLLLGEHAGKHVHEKRKAKA